MSNGSYKKLQTIHLVLMIIAVVGILVIASSMVYGNFIINEKRNYPLKYNE